jgi:hypothetical protein
MKWYQSGLKIILILLLSVLTACGGNTPPKGLAPERDIIKHAIARKITLTENRLTEQLDQPLKPMSSAQNGSRPQDSNLTDFKVQNLKIKTLNPLYIADLPTYQITGTYTLKLNLPRQEITQEQNEFEIYLQRQVEGKTWRLLIKETSPPVATEEEQEEKATAWASYLVT